MKHKRPPSECPVCGAEVPPHARACPECGADERSGWNEDETRYDGLDLPESAFEDGEGRNEGVGKRKRATKTVSVFWWIVGLGLLAILACLLLHPAL
jgi:hypothetical protein